ncbi:MAG TPA: ABC transporter substrate-binding protein [Spirochaetota bacterium]|nr:ABC transporter substrate-binding protein [Spirochaetota bacterium]
MNKKKIIVIIAAVVLFSPGCNCGKKTKIALMTKLESGSVVGVSEVNAAKMFIEEKGADNIEIIPFDDAWDPEKTVKAYEDILKSGIKIIITSHTSSCAVAISDFVNRDRVLMLVTGSTTDVLSDRDDYILRNVHDVRQEQKLIADYIKSQRFSPLLIVRDTENAAYTEPALRYFREAFNGGKIKTIDLNISQFNTEQLERRVRSLKFNALYILIGGHKAAAGSIAQIVRKIRPSVPVIYTPWMKTPAIIETAGATIADSVFPSIYPERALHSSVDSYFRRYIERYKEPPTFISINVYSAIQILKTAIDAGFDEPDSIKEYILREGTIQTDFGPVTFNRYGDTESPLYFITDIRQEFRK